MARPKERALSEAQIDATLAKVEYYRTLLGEDDADEKFRHDTLEGQTEFFEDMDALLHLWLEDTGMVEFMKTRSQRMNKRRDKIKAYLTQLMNKGGFHKLQRALGTLSLAQRKGLNILDRSRVPHEFWVWKIDEDALEKALRAGMEIKGAARVGQPFSLTIRKD